MKTCSIRQTLGSLIVLSVCLQARLGHGEEPPKLPEGVAYQADIEYGRGAGEPLLLDLAWPEAIDKPTPCVVVIHGGGWSGGKKTSHTDLILKLARRGYVATTISYRLCPEHRFPAQIHDVKCAVRFLRAHAEKYHIQSNRIGTVGFSAGAHLVMMLGTMGEVDGLEGDGGWENESSRVQAVVSYAGPTDLAAEDISVIAKPIVRNFIGGTAQEKPEEFRLASPLTYVTAGDAPMLLFQGTKDPLIPTTQAIKMAEAMSRAGVAGRVEILVGAQHGWSGLDLERSVQQMNNFLDRYLRPEQTKK